MGRKDFLDMLLLTSGFTYRGGLDHMPLYRRTTGRITLVVMLSVLIMLLPKIIGQFKMRTAKYLNHSRNTPGCAVWQRSYHDRIIRTEDELNRIRFYIRNNPQKWEWDRNNPSYLIK